MNDNLLTKSGVAYDLTISPHKYKVIYDNNEVLIFTFSSKLYLSKFNDKLNEHREKVNQSLSKRFGFEVEYNQLCDIKLYSSIEKRGFLIDNTKERFECLSTIKLDGNNLTTKN